MAKKWIQGAIKKPGALRKSLGAKKGKNIPAKKLQAAAKKGGKIGKRARLAITLKKLRKMLVKRFNEPVHIEPDPVSNIITLSLYIPTAKVERRMPISWLDERQLTDWVRIKVAKKRKKCAAWEAKIFYKKTEEVKSFSANDPLEDIVEWLDIRYCIFRFEN